MENKKTIRVRCEGTDFLELDKLEILQGGLKILETTGYEKLRKGIIRDGFVSPFFIWKNAGHNWILDGTQRKVTLDQLKKDGWNVPPLPIVNIDADDLCQARRRILQFCSQYGKMTGQGLYEFINDPDAMIDLDDVDVSFQFPEIDLEQFRAEFVDEKQEETAEPVSQSNSFDIPLEFKPRLQEQISRRTEILSRGISGAAQSDMYAMAWELVLGELENKSDEEILPKA